MEPIEATPQRRKKKPLWRREGRWAFGGTCGRCGKAIAMGEKRWVHNITGELRHIPCYQGPAAKAPKPKL
jgi:hypothetical protein